MKKQNHFLPLILIVFAWPGGSTAQAQSADAVAAWGDNGYGQTDVPVAARSEVMSIAAGQFHTVALRRDGSVLAWGNNDFGQTTVPITAQSGLTAIAAGELHTVALKSDGSVIAWGFDCCSLTKVPVAARSGVIAIAAGGTHNAALKSNGSVIAWGNNGSRQTTVPAGLSGVAAIAAGGGHTVALKNDGTVVAWGNNGYGQVTGTPTTDAPTASPVILTGQVFSGVRAIAAGHQHTVALRNDGTVVVWGNNEAGQVTGIPYSDNSATAIASPVMLGGQVLTGVTAIAAGRRHTVALKSDGTIVAWGSEAWQSDYYGATTVPAGLSGVSTIAAGGDHTVAIFIPTAPTITAQPLSQTVNVWQSASFTVTAMGYPLSYQWRKDGVGLAGATNATYSLPFAQTNQAGSSYTVVVSNPIGSVTSAPPAVLTVNATAAPGTVVAWGDNGGDLTSVPVAAQSAVVAIAAGGYHTVALKTDGSVVDWGKIYDWKYYVAVTVPADLSGVRAIAAGGGFNPGALMFGHTVAVKTDGSVVAWGSLNQTTVPAGLTGVVAIAAGRSHTVAVKTDGSVVAWGSLDQTTVPAGLTGVVAIAAGRSHIVAVKTDGSVVSWGDNWAGQTTVPSGLNGVTAIAAGDYHTVALRNDGSVVAWGDNAFGQVTGTPTTDNLPAIASPVTLGGQVLSGVTAIAAGSYHTAALKSDGTIVAWGGNDFGQTTVPTGLSGVTAIAAGLWHTVALIGAVRLLPSLNARPSGNNLILSWPTNAVGFTLQSTLNITPPVTWMDSAFPPVVIGAQFTVTNTPSGSAQFYRLRKL